MKILDKFIFEKESSIDATNYLIDPVVSDELSNSEINQKELLALSIIENSILQKYLDPEITDLSFNGKNFYIQHNQNGRMKIEDPSINKENMFTLIKKIADQTGNQFNVQCPILDTSFKNYRINAIHPSLARTQGEKTITLSIRKSTPMLRFSDGDLNVCPKAIFLFLQAIIRSKVSILISGETGSGKTELQKFLVGYCHPDHKVTVIEDTYDSYIKDLYPNLDVNSWVVNLATKSQIGLSNLVQASLRNNPDWVIVSETRGQEAYHMIQSVMTGHPIITTLHSKDAASSVYRLAHMVSESRQIDEDLLIKKIVDHVKIGIHMECYFDYKQNKMVRQIKEVIEYVDYQGKLITNPIYMRNKKQVKNEFKITEKVGTISNELLEHFIYHEVDRKCYQALIKKEKTKANETVD